MKTVLVLGGYGNFGRKIVENLCEMEMLTVVICGRSITKANQLVNDLQSRAKATLKAVAIDIFSDMFLDKLKEISPDLVIHTSGPFQEQDYAVPKACIEAGAHYIDLADDRRFVCDIAELDSLAKAQGVLVITGASSVPGLSSAVIDHYQDQFGSIDSIDLSIAPGNKAERGLATVYSILSYTGQTLNVFKGGKWQDIHGWMDSKVNDFGEIVGKRHLANVDVPDLELFPARYKVSESVSFQAGLEIPFLHRSMVGMAYLSKIGLVKTWVPLSKVIVKASNLFLPFGSDTGAMQVQITGLDKNGKNKKITWRLYAANGNGPYIPTLSTIILAKKLLENNLDDTGAKPCMGLLKIEDFKEHFEALDIYTIEQVDLTER